MRELTEINRLINEVERRHSRIFRLDETMRLTLNIPQSDDIKMFGTGGRYHPSKGGRILESKGGALNKRLELIKRGVAKTEESLAEVDYNLRSSRKQLKHIPSIMPTWGRITSGFGWRNDPFTGRRAFHNGLDIANRAGTPVIATASGEVVYVGRMGRLGLTVRIDHGYGYTTLYGHLKSFAVELYDRVERRDIIGYMGSTGRSTGPHLHYIVQKYGRDLNPINYILFGKVLY
ncbi:M23 family metallopeptidase [candidate division WOR-3 bacterium]|nr:M23 family metallopeptidase [candidate division WOR-3 bacterium]